MEHWLAFLGHRISCWRYWFLDSHPEKPDGWQKGRRLVVFAKNLWFSWSLRRVTTLNIILFSAQHSCPLRYLRMWLVKFLPKISKLLFTNDILTQFNFSKVILKWVFKKRVRWSPISVDFICLTGVKCIGECQYVVLVILHVHILPFWNCLSAVISATNVGLYDGVINVAHYESTEWFLFLFACDVLMVKCFTKSLFSRVGKKGSVWFSLFSCKPFSVKASKSLLKHISGKLPMTRNVRISGSGAHKPYVGR